MATPFACLYTQEEQQCPAAPGGGHRLAGWSRVQCGRCFVQDRIFSYKQVLDHKGNLLA